MTIAKENFNEFTVVSVKEVTFKDGSSMKRVYVKTPAGDIGSVFTREALSVGDTVYPHVYTSSSDDKFKVTFKKL